MGKVDPTVERNNRSAAHGRRVGNPSWHRSGLGDGRTRAVQLGSHDTASLLLVDLGEGNPENPIFFW